MIQVWLAILEDNNVMCTHGPSSNCEHERVSTLLHEVASNFCYFVFLTTSFSIAYGLSNDKMENQIEIKIHKLFIFIRPWLFICWITSHFEKFQSAAIGKKNNN